jgi:transglutaminase-like putative cysteine protease
VYDQYAQQARETNLAITGSDMREPAEFTIKLFYAVSTVFVVPQPLWVSRPAEATLSTNTDGTVDVTTLKADNTIRPGEEYQVRAGLSSVTVSQLREAGADYPDWVVDRYLQLPDDITQRTVLLGQSIATGFDNSYDVAQAVTDYLRDNIKYTEIIPEPPLNQERIDWFLFDLQEGFCNYYASAEVILLRSLGIPARIAVGYNEGERTAGIEQALPPGATIPGPDSLLLENVTFVVGKKLTPWPEVFPGIGWVEFEPTASQAPIVRPVGDIDLSSLENENAANPEIPPLTRQEDFPQPGGLEGLSLQNTPSILTNIVFLLIVIFALGLIGYVLWQKRRGVEIIPKLVNFSNQIPIKLEKGLLRLGLQPPNFLIEWANYASMPGLSRSYLEVNRALRRLGKPTTQRDTPAERVDQLTVVLPQASVPGQKLLNEYQLGVYSSHDADEIIAGKAGSEIRKLSILARIQRLISRFQEPRRDNLYRR